MCCSTGSCGNRSKSTNILNFCVACGNVEQLQYIVDNVLVDNDQKYTILLEFVVRNRDSNMLRYVIQNKDNFNIIKPTDGLKHIIDDDMKRFHPDIDIDIDLMII